jgi:RNA polymerase sporulation-specific sigma factor
VDLSLLNDSIQKLNKREYMIMKLRFGLNNTKSFTQKEVADILGISQSYISRLEKKILNRLKKDINKAV